MPSIENAKILVIGGAGFVGSHIVDQLLEEPVGEVVVLDNFVRGTRENLEPASADERVTIVEGSVLDLDLLTELMQGADHLPNLCRPDEFDRVVLEFLAG
jgi:UDP-glucose 4-epimerase